MEVLFTWMPCAEWKAEGRSVCVCVCACVCVLIVIWFNPFRQRITVQLFHTGGSDAGQMYTCAAGAIKHKSSETVTEISPTSAVHYTIMLAIKNFNHNYKACKVD